MKKLTSKQMVNELYLKSLNPVLNFSDEQLELITKLHQAFETAEEKTIRQTRFRQIVANVQHAEI